MPFTRSFESYSPPRRYDGAPFTSAQIREAATETGSYTTIETINLFPVDADPSSPATRNFTTTAATLTDGWYVIRWVDGTGSSFDSDPVHYITGSGTPAQFATVEDVATRQGKTLTEAEEESVDFLLTVATAVIADAAGKDDAWAAALDPVPTILKGLTVELVGRAFANPSGLTSLQEQVGSYQYMQSFNRDLPAAFVLTDIERRIIRRTVGTLNYEVRTPTSAEEFLEEVLETEGS
jgi:hypothetical protein